MSNKCREEFEKWFDGDLSRSQIRPGFYAHNQTHDAFMAWREAWSRSKVPPVNRDGWLTAEKIDDIRVAMFNWRPFPPDVLSKALDMAASAISLHAERAALFAQLRAAIDTIERGNA